MADLFFNFNILAAFSAELAGLLFAMEPGAGAWRWSKLVWGCRQRRRWNF
jgi:hypothetical protein